MSVQDTDARWKRLIALLRPMHCKAAGTARRLCRSAADGDDLYQETVLRAFEKLHTLRDESKFGSWFYSILLSRHRSRVRLRLWRRTVPLEEVLGSGNEPAGEDRGQWMEEAWRAGRAARALGSLAAVQREAIVLFELDGYSLEEIATMQGVTLSAVKTRLSRGRGKLRRFYEKHGWKPRLEAAPVAGAAARGEPQKEGSVL